MKIIDLLNKIANGEEAPKKIKHEGTIYDYYERLNEFYNYKNEEKGYLEDAYFLSNILNDEVEIIEEEKEIERLNLDTNELKGKETVRAIDYLLESKINELIDEVKKLKEDK